MMSLRSAAESGRAEMAPFFVVQIAPQAFANASPAPVVSTVFTAYPFTLPFKILGQVFCPSVTRRSFTLPPHKLKSVFFSPHFSEEGNLSVAYIHQHESKLIITIRSQKYFIVFLTLHATLNNINSQYVLQNLGPPTGTDVYFDQHRLSLSIQVVNFLYF